MRCNNPNHRKKDTPSRGILFCTNLSFFPPLDVQEYATPSRIPLPNFRKVAKMPSVPLFLRFPQKFHFCGSPKKKKMPFCTILESLDPNKTIGHTLFSRKTTKKWLYGERKTPYFCAIFPKRGVWKQIPLDFLCICYIMRGGIL